MPTTEPRVRIVQCLCPERHCIMTLPYLSGMTTVPSGRAEVSDLVLDESNASDFLRGVVEGGIKFKMINPWCAICGLTEWRYEDDVTIFKSMEEAQPFLKMIEDANTRARMELGKY